MGKRLIKVVGAVVFALLAVAIIVAAVVWWRLDSLAQQGIERGMSNALGVETRTGSVQLAPFAGRVDVTGLTVDNPEGFEQELLLRSETVTVEVKPTTVLSDIVEVPRVELADVRLNIERRGTTTNVNEVLANLQRDDQPPGRKLHVERLVIRDLVAHVQTAPAGGEATTLDVPISRIELTDLTPGENNGAVVAELTRRVMPAVIAAVIEQGGQELPTELVRGLSAELVEAAGGVGQRAVELLEQAAGQRFGQVLQELAPELRQRLDDTVKDTLDQVIGPGSDGSDGDGQPLDNLGEGLRGLLGGQEQQREGGSSEDGGGG